MTYSTIYWMDDGMVATDGVQSQAVCDETINTARRLAYWHGRSVIVEDRGTHECYRITPSGRRWKAPRSWVPEHDVCDGRVIEEALAKRSREAREERARQRVADRIDGYDRDDLGESPDY
jgi:hypothetical protein